MDAYSPEPPLPQVKNSGLAISSLVLGILGLVFLCIGPLFAIPGVICGHIAHGRIKRSGGTLSGGGLALAGMITGYISIAAAIFVIPLMAAIAIPNFVRARDVAQRNACINNLRMIDGAKQQWALESKKTEDDVPTPEDLAPYLRMGFEELHCPAGGVYSINKVSDAPTCSHEGHSLPGYTQQRSTTGSATPNWQQRLDGIRIRRGPFPPSFDTNRNPNVRFYPSTNGAAASSAFHNKSVCDMNLARIRSAKQQWIIVNHKGPGDAPEMNDLLNFLPNHQVPVCPDGGTYTIGAAGEFPTCSVPGHGHPAIPARPPEASAPK